MAERRIAVQPITNAIQISVGPKEVRGSGRGATPHFKTIRDTREKLPTNIPEMEKPNIRILGARRESATSLNSWVGRPNDAKREKEEPTTSPVRHGRCI